MKLAILIVGLILVALVEADLHQPAVPVFAATLTGLILLVIWKEFNDAGNDHDHFA